MIPEDTDVLVTHGPPMGKKDQVWRGGPNLGCADLMERVKIVKPILHVFGHIHAGAGYTQDEHTTYVNASVVDEAYCIKYPATVIDLKRNGNNFLT